jgi:hypothetical protein
VPVLHVLPGMADHGGRGLRIEVRPDIHSCRECRAEVVSPVAEVVQVGGDVRGWDLHQVVGGIMERRGNQELVWFG